MKIIKIDYKYQDDEDLSSFEIFDNIENAYNFTQDKSIIVEEISLREVNQDRVYFEKDIKKLNYEDVSDLFLD